MLSLCRPPKNTQLFGCFSLFPPGIAVPLLRPGEHASALAADPKLSYGVPLQRRHHLLRGVAKGGVLFGGVGNLIKLETFWRWLTILVIFSSYKNWDGKGKRWCFGGFTLKLMTFCSSRCFDGLSKWRPGDSPNSTWWSIIRFTLRRPKKGQACAKT